MQPAFESIRLAAQLHERQLRADAKRSRHAPRSNARRHGLAAWRGLSLDVIASIARILTNLRESAVGEVMRSTSPRDDRLRGRRTSSTTDDGANSSETASAIYKEEEARCRRAGQPRRDRPSGRVGYRARRAPLLGVVAETPRF
jgi:hypothetical protein